MSVKIPLKPKAKLVVSSEPKVKTIGEVLDEYVDLDKKLAKTRDKIAALQLALEPLAALEKQIAAYVQDQYPATVDPLMEHTVEGSHSRMRVRKATTKREVVNKAVIKKAMGAKKYEELAEIKLGDIDKYLTPEEQAQALKVTYTKRAFDIEPKHPDA